MFKFQKDYIYEWPVHVKYPDPEPKHTGRFAEETFIGQFKTQDVEAQKLQTEKLIADRNLDLGIEIMKDVWAGWKEGEVKDAEGKPLPNDDEHRALLLRNPYVLKGVSEAYRASNSPEGKHTRHVKNL